MRTNRNQLVPPPLTLPGTRRGRAAPNTESWRPRVFRAPYFLSRISCAVVSSVFIVRRLPEQKERREVRTIAEADSGGHVTTGCGFRVLRRAVRLVCSIISRAGS